MLSEVTALWSEDGMEQGRGNLPKVLFLCTVEGYLDELLPRHASWCVRPRGYTMDSGDFTTRELLS